MVWESEGLGCLTKPCLGSGYGVSRRKLTGYRNQIWGGLWGVV